MQKLQSTVLVASNDLANFERVREHLNKKAIKFGLDPIRVLSKKTECYKRVIRYVGPEGDKLESKLVPLQQDDPETRPILLERIELEYPLIRLGDWTVVGKLEASGQEGNLVFSVGGNAADEKQLMSHGMQALRCEHCETKRARKTSFLLRSDVGEYKVVGSTCLKDFTGIDPGAALFLADMYGLYNMAVDLEMWDDKKCTGGIGTVAYLIAVAYLSEINGFVSATRAREQACLATYEMALDLMIHRNNNELRNEIREGYEACQVAMHARVMKIIAWFASKQACDSYTHNVKLLLAQPTIKQKAQQLAFAASAVASYMRDQESTKAKQQPSEHFGQPGQKHAGQLLVTRVITTPSRFVFNKLDYLILLEDETGNRMRWKTGSPPAALVDGQGKWFRVSFKVKEHGEYKDVKQTSITHLKLTSVPMSV